MQSTYCRILLVSFLFISLPGCQHAGQPVPDNSHAQLYALFDEYREAYLELNPLNAMFEGDYRFNDRLGDYLSPEYLQDSELLEEGTLNKLKDINYDRLSSEDQLSYSAFKYYREMAYENFHDGYARMDTLIPVTQFFSIPTFMAQLGGGTSAQPFSTVKDYDDWLSRIGEFPAWVEQAIVNMRTGIKEGVVLSKVIVQRALPQLTAIITEDAQSSVFYKPVLHFPDSFSKAEQDRLTTAYKKSIREVIVPSYKKLYHFMEQKYYPHALDTVGIGYFPGGREWYTYLARYHTTTDMTPAEIHQFGKQQATRIFAEMQAIKSQVGFEGEMQAFFKYLRDDPRFLYNTPEELLNSYRQLKDDVTARLPRLFNLMPKADFVIKPIEEFRQVSSAAAEYLPPAPDGSRPAIFYVNTYDLPARPNWDRESLFIHEAVPGHHFQIAIAQERENLPAFQRFDGPTAFVEGWGLYAETLGEELGLYTDPYQKMGALTNQIWRANRLVVDTGMHALGWSREQAIAWMESNSPRSHTDIVAEVERYISIPGQALAYMIGQHEIRSLRDYAEKALGDKFDVHQFHYQVLADGALPLSLLHKKIENWVAANR